MKKTITTLFLLLLTVTGFSDSPMPAPESRRVCNIFITHCAYLEPQMDSIVYSVNGNFELKEIYRIKGWHRSFLISPSGEYVAIGYPGLNLLSKSGDPNPVMVSIYHKSQLTQSVKLRELFHDLNSLKPTVSHYLWGSIDSVTDFYVILNTVEGRV